MSPIRHELPERALLTAKLVAGNLPVTTIESVIAGSTWADARQTAAYNGRETIQDSLTRGIAEFGRRARPAWMSSMKLSSPTVRIANFDVVEVRQVDPPEESGGTPQTSFEIQVRSSDGAHRFAGRAADEMAALAELIAHFCTISSTQDAKLKIDAKVVTAGQSSSASITLLSGRGRGAGRFVSNERAQALVVAALRAASNAGILRSEFRANNQKMFRYWAEEFSSQNERLHSEFKDPDERHLHSQALALDYFNRIASAAVITATNHPRQNSLLRLYDTSAWLFDAQGRPRESCKETESWLAWFPGLLAEDQSVRSVVDSMPRSPAAAIPWIVKVFENPSSWLRFRGAIDLEDHDVLHVLLGRGLQDQDEAFVIGFAMGTSKRESRIERWLFRFVISRFYPEPYRIPSHLLPAFDIGVQCGLKTGCRQLYKKDLSAVLDLGLEEARQKLEIDRQELLRHFELERQAIPSTVASVRLPR